MFPHARNDLLSPVLGQFQPAAKLFDENSVLHHQGTQPFPEGVVLPAERKPLCPELVVSRDRVFIPGMLRVSGHAHPY